MVDRRVKVYLDGDISNFNRALLEAAAGAKAFSRELDTSSDRMTNLTQSALALGPALVPLSAAAVPAIAGLSNQLGIGAAAAGVAVLAFHGFGKALDAVNNYSINPTDANLKKLNQTMGAIGPAGRDFVLFLQRARPEMQNLQDIAQAGLFPGLEEGLRLMSGLLPDVENVISTIATTIGGLADEAGKNLDSPKWHEFIAFINAEARPTLQAMAYTAGNLIEAFANLWMAFGPMSNNFSKSFLNMARDFNTWTEGLSQTQGFQDFLSYVNRVGPEAWDTLGALANALLQIVEAAAPVGEATLPVIKALSNAVAGIADSDFGPVIIGILSLTSAMSRLRVISEQANTGVLGGRLSKSIGGVVKAAADLPAASRAYLTLGSSIQKSGYSLGQFSSSSERLSASLKGTGKLVAGGAGLAFVMGGYADKVHLANTATLALAGSMFGPEGAAIGGTIGLIKDLRSQHNQLTDTITRTIEAQKNGTLSLDQQKAAIDQIRPSIDKLKDVSKSVGFVKDDAAKGAAGLKQLEDAYAANVRQAQDALFAENGLAGSMVNTSQKARDQMAAMLALRDAHNETTNTLLAGANAQLAYEQALDEASAGAKKNKNGLDANTATGRANLQLLYNLAGAWDNLTDAQRNAPGAADRARKAFIETAFQMSGNRRQAEQLANAYLKIPDKAATKILVQGQKEAAAAIKAVQNLLSHLNGKVANTYVKTHYSSDGRSMTGGGNTAHVADGGYITGPGGPRDDAIPAWLSNGEFVVNAAATAKNLDLLHQLNAQRFASGGPVMQRMAPSGYLASAALSGTSAPTIPDMPIVDGSQVIGYLRDVATARARIEIADYDLKANMEAVLG